MDEISLVKRCQQGDLDAFRILVERLSTKALRTSYLIVGRKDIAEDVVQEAFIQCHREIKRLRTPETFETWFYRMLVRLSWRMASKEKGRLPLEPLDNAKGISTGDDDVTDTVETKERQQAVQQAVRRLSAPLRTTIVLRYFNGLSVKEIARVLNCRVGTVKSRLHNAAKRLAVELKQNGWEPSLGGEENPPDKQNVEREIKECEIGA
ncbi:MAG: RNA polymerase sigma factor [Bacillota bacterium]